MNWAVIVGQVQGGNRLSWWNVSYNVYPFCLELWRILWGFFGKCHRFSCFLVLPSKVAPWRLVSFICLESDSSERDKEPECWKWAMTYRDDRPISMLSVLAPEFWCVLFHVFSLSGRLKTVSSPSFRGFLWEYCAHIFSQPWREQWYLPIIRWLEVGEELTRPVVQMIDPKMMLLGERVGSELRSCEMGNSQTCELLSFSFFSVYFSSSFLNATHVFSLGENIPHLCSVDDLFCWNYHSGTLISLQPIYRHQFSCILGCILWDAGSCSSRLCVFKWRWLSALPQYSMPWPIPLLPSDPKSAVGMPHPLCTSSPYWVVLGYLLSFF